MEFTAMSDVDVDNNVESLVVNIIYHVNGVLPKDISLKDSLINDLLMDSVELIDLLMRLEEIGVIIPESCLSSELTVGDIVQRVKQYTHH
jgi:acyl carrier protein